MDPREYRLVEEVYGDYAAFQRMLSASIAVPERTPRILEIGFGSGATTRAVQRAFPNALYQAIDNNEAVVRFADGWRKSSWKNVEFIEAEALYYVKHCPPETFDVILSAFTIHNLSIAQRSSLYPAIVRALKPGGQFINADKFVSRSREAQLQGLKFRIGKYVEHFMRKGKPDLLKEWLAHYIDDHDPEKIQIIDDEIKRLESAGFSRVRRVYMSSRKMMGIVSAYKP